jgi:hypothetical protein
LKSPIPILQSLTPNLCPLAPPMPRLTFAMPHSLGSDEARRRLKDKLAAALAEHKDRLSDFREQWQEHTLTFGFRALGIAVGGTVAVEPAQVTVDAELPFAAMLFKGAIEQRLRQEVGTLLAPE